ncbi:MAG: hypothetical protein ABIQ39_12995 [Ilumatobacteraceae bacterium]
MLTESGFDVLERICRVSVVERPDPEIAWRAISSVGPAVPALRHTEPTIVKRAVLEAIETCRDARGRTGSATTITDNFVIARRRAT